MPKTQKSSKKPITFIRRCIQIISFILLNYVILESIFNTNLNVLSRIFKSVPFLHTANDAWSGGAGLIEYTFYSISRGQFPYLFIGLIGVFSIFTGRFACGWFCPTGFIQDLLSKFTKEHKRFSKEGDLRFKKVKLYIVILLIILITPLGYYYINDIVQYVLYSESIGDLKNDPTGPFSLSNFLFHVIPTMLKEIAESMSFTYIFGPDNRWRIFIFFFYLIILGLSVVYPRFYCKYLCIYGAVSKIFAEYSLLKLSRAPARCVGRKKCGACERVCDMQIRILDEPYSGFNGDGECILCLKCMEVCTEKGYDAIKMKFGF